MIANAIEGTFSSSEWTELGYLTGTNDHVDRHPRLLRSLNWSDPDYKGHVIDAVALILERDPENLRVLIEYGRIKEWLAYNEPGALAALQAKVGGAPVPQVSLSQSVIAQHALQDAEALLGSRGPTSAVDRVHTALHGFLRDACAGATIPFDKDATANQLLKLLINSHPSLKNLGPRTADVQRLIKASGSIVDALGTLRNQASLAHPNEELLDRDEALLAINLTKSLIHFLDAKLRSSE